MLHNLVLFAAYSNVLCINSTIHRIYVKLTMPCIRWENFCCKFCSLSATAIGPQLWLGNHISDIAMYFRLHQKYKTSTMQKESNKQKN